MAVTKRRGEGGRVAGRGCVWGGMRGHGHLRSMEYLEGRGGGGEGQQGGSRLT